MGTVWETFVYGEFRKRANFSLGPATLWYYRDAQGREIDFLEVRDGLIHLFEVKWMKSGDPRWIASLKEAAALLSRSKVYRTGNTHLLCRTLSTLVQEGTNVVHPASFFNRGS